MLVAIDFETEAISNRPAYPPKPVGVAVQFEGKAGQYYSWGHPGPNNFTEEKARDIVEMLMDDPEHEFVCHNAPFDLSIVSEKWGLTVPWDRVHDTMLMAFLDNPHGELSLKPLAEQHLHEPPEEQDAVRQWLVRHGVVASNSKSWGAYISKAPMSVVAPYAIGDVDRTIKLYRFFEQKLKARGIL